MEATVHHTLFEQQWKKWVKVEEGIRMYNYYFAFQMRVAAQNVY